ncbi:MAG: hypothetical protein K5884_09625 [Ruminococcus sp.]|nr:hypothetical protein [Ruminococcus sp.]
MSEKNIHSGHRERLRSRFLETGITGFSEHELLELLLFYSIPRANINSISHALLQRFGSIKGVLSASPEELSSVKGVGSSSAVMLNLIGSIIKEIGSRSAPPTGSIQDIIRSYLDKKFAGCDKELFTILFTAPDLTLISSRDFEVREMISGTISPRTIVEDVLIADARSIIIGINRPDNFTIPTDTDYRLIKAISEPLSYIGTKVADVVIYNKGKCYSMKLDGSFSF